MKKENSKVIEELGTAIKTEIAGHVFYKQAAKLVEDERGKNIFKHLAVEELEHMEVVSSIADAMKEGREWPLYRDALREGAKKELPIFPDTNELVERLKEDPSDANALHIAMDSEEKAVHFYLEMLKGASNPAEKLLLTRLLEMERGHLKLLRWESEALAHSGFWCDVMEYSVEKEIG